MAAGKLIFVVACIGTFAACAQNIASTENRLEDGTPVRLRLQRTISSADARVDEGVDFDVIEEVKINGMVVIPKGSLALGTVTVAQPKRRMARGGKLDINIDSVRLVNGDKAALRAVKSLSGGGHTGAMAGAMVVTGLLVWPASPFFLLMHGKDVTIPKGTEITAYINGTVDLAAINGEGLKDEAARLVSPPPAAAPAPAPAPPDVASPGVVDPSTVIIKSNPDGGEITIDGKFVGSTPSTVQLLPGEHSIAVQQPGFKMWQRQISIGSGSIINLNALLEKDRP